MALTEFMKKDLVKFIVSTNVDGLHLRSGIPPNKLSELHGNTYLETCCNCGRFYLRKFEVHGDLKHVTGRLCEVPECAGLLKDSIINFGENLPEKELEITSDHSKKCDLSLVMGTSMRVSPACLFPGMACKTGGKMVIINLQTTPCKFLFLFMMLLLTVWNKTM